ncbi:MAG: hypothetical protein KGJ57_14045 [Sphingomonadales bacterium]|nr:hypothetical protein [Sphingomonadales bacterium]
MINALPALAGFTALASLRLMFSPQSQRGPHKRVRNRSIEEMERNLALFEATHATGKGKTGPLIRR